MVAPTRARVFMRGVMKLAMVETNTSSTAIRARMTLMSFPSRARALAFSTPSSCTTCCCCCCSSSLVMRVRQDSTASCGHTHTHTHTHTSCNQAATSRAPSRETKTEVTKTAIHRLATRGGLQKGVNPIDFAC